MTGGKERGNSSSSMSKRNNKREKDARGGVAKRECVIVVFLSKIKIT